METQTLKVDGGAWRSSKAHTGSLNKTEQSVKDKGGKDPDLNVQEGREADETEVEQSETG